MKAPKTLKKTYLLPAGTHHAVCYAVWDLGYQETTWEGKKSIKPQMYIAFETSERIESQDEYNGKRFAINRKYNFTLGNKSDLTKDLIAWQGSMDKEQRYEFDFESLIGQNCLLNVVHNEGEERTYANIAGISPILKGMPILVPENKSDAPEWIKEKQANAVPQEQTESENE